MNNERSRWKIGAKGGAGSLSVTKPCDNEEQDMINIDDIASLLLTASREELVARFGQNTPQ